MSGIDEREISFDVPECPNCDNSVVFVVGKYVWMFSDKACEDRGLKYSLFFEDMRGSHDQIKEMFDRDEICCWGCKTFFSNETFMYRRLKYVFTLCVDAGKFYGSWEEILRDDRCC